MTPVREKKEGMIQTGIGRAMLEFGEGVTRRVLVDVKRGEQDGFGEIKLVDLLHRHLC